MAWYPRYTRDALVGMASLTPEQRGIYNTCLDLMYERGGPILDDARWLASANNCTMQAWRRVRKQLIDLKKFTLTDDGRLANGRATYELHRYKVRSAAQAEKAKARPPKKPGKNQPVFGPESNDINTVGVAEPPTKESRPEPTPIRENPGKNPSLFGPEFNELNELTRENPERKNSSSTESVSASRVEEEKIIAAWKGTDLPQPRSLTSERRRHLAARIKDHGVDGVLEAIANMAKSPFCHGVGARPGWKADFDTLLQPGFCTKAKEGRYNREVPAVAVPRMASLGGGSFAPRMRSLGG